MTLRKRRAFKARPLHRKKDPHAMQYLSQKVTFWIAVVSLLAFVTGNMIGQHGVWAFWKSVLGQQDDSLIVYTGTVPPLARVPDYRQWKASKDPQATFAAVPPQMLIALPRYDSATAGVSDYLFYSIGYMGSYETGAEQSGSHPGVDIRTPVGTPVQAVMNGIVTAVREDRGGFGNYVVLRHPNVPDPTHPGKTVTLFSTYAHLSKQLVVEGEIVQKGQEIAFSGQSGLASGPHLHFQIDRATFADGTPVPSHPYWPFTGAEAAAAGASFSRAVDSGLNQAKALQATINPMLYVQAQYAPVQIAIAPKKTPEQLRQDRLDGRLARLKAQGQQVAIRSTIVVENTDAATHAAAPEQASSSSVASSVAPIVDSMTSAELRGYENIAIRVPRTFTGRTWERVSVTLLDASGNAVTNPKLPSDLYLRTAFGTAEFRPPTLSALDFKNGTAQVEMLPLTHKTVVVQIQPGGAMSQPMKFEEGK